MDDDTPVPSVRQRSISRRIIDRLLHVRPEPPPCAHCHHVSETHLTVKIHNKLLFVALGALMTVLARDLISYLGARVRWEPPPSGNAERLGADRVGR